MDACCSSLCKQPASLSTPHGPVCRNYCDRPGGCSFAGSSFSPSPLRLSHRQCQLRYNFLSNTTFGAPLIVAVSGQAA